MSILHCFLILCGNASANSFLDLYILLISVTTASNNADIQKTIETIQNMMERGLVNPRAASMVIGSLRKAVVNQ